MKVNEKANPVDFKSKEVNEELVREALVKGISQMKQFNERMDRQYPNSIDKAGEWVKCPYSPATPKFNKWFKKIFNCCPITGKKLEEVNEVLNPADLKKEEVNQVERALEDLKKALLKPLEADLSEDEAKSWRDQYFLVCDAGWNFVNALEVEKNMPNPKPKTDIKEERVEPVSIWKDVNSAIKEEPKWLPISCAPKCGSVITVQEKNNQRHKIFKAQWFLNKWYSLYKEGGNEEVNPEFWLEGSKEEPKTDMKEEHVEPVSIWKDVSKLPRCLDGAAVFYKRDGQTFIGEAHSFGVIAIYPDSNSEHLNNEDIDKVCLVGDFINSFEQMQKDIEERKCKETYRCAHDYVLKNQGYNNSNYLIKKYECSICGESKATIQE